MAIGPLSQLASREVCCLANVAVGPLLCLLIGRVAVGSLVTC